VCVSVCALEGGGGFRVGTAPSMAPARAGQDPTGTILEATGPGLARTAPERCQRSLKMFFLKPIDFYVGAMLVLPVFLRVTETAARCALCLWTMALLSKYIVAGFVTFSKCGQGTCDGAHAVTEPSARFAHGK
jgi:hypothetical protein